MFTKDSKRNPPGQVPLRRSYRPVVLGWNSLSKALLATFVLDLRYKEKVLIPFVQRVGVMYSMEHSVITRSFIKDTVQ